MFDEKISTCGILQFKQIPIRVFFLFTNLNGWPLEFVFCIHKNHWEKTLQRLIGFTFTHLILGKNHRLGNCDRNRASNMSSKCLPLKYSCFGKYKKKHNAAPKNLLCFQASKILLTIFTAT